MHYNGLVEFNTILNDNLANFAGNGTDVLELGGEIAPLKPTELCWDPNKIRGPDMEPIWAQIGYDLEPEKIILEPPGVQFAESGTDLLEFGGQITFLEPSELCWDPNKVRGPDLEPT